MSQVNISGAVSGVDTASLINSLVSVQQNQQTLLKNQQTQQQKAADTLGSLISSLGNLSTLATGLSKTSAWKGATASSTSTGVIANATATLASSLTFDVTSVATSHSLVSHSPVGSLSTQVASGPLTFTRADGSTVAVPTGSGSLADVVAAVNASKAGVTASAVQTAPGQYRLQLTAGSTGSASQFTVSGLDGVGGIDVLSQGKDAQITIGSDPATAFTVTSSTNTFADVVPGLSFTVTRPETGVTVASKVDGSAVADDVQKLVDAANSVLSSISAATQWNATTKTGGALVGDSTARTLQQSILSLVGGADAPGVSLSRSGKLTFDKAAFGTAFAKDPAGVAAAFGATSSFTPASGVSGQVSFSSSTATTQAGSYAVTVSQTAATEQWSLPTAAAGSTIQLTRGTSSISYTVGATDTAADIASGIGKASAAAGFGVGASVSASGELLLAATSAGSGSAFTTTVDGAAAGTRLSAGRDVAGTIDGQVATGVGSVLTLPSGTGGAVGLALKVTVSDAEVAATGGNLGSVQYTPGLASRFVQLVQQQTASGTGILSSAKTGRESAVKALQSQIDDWDTRLTAYRASLQSQFTAMETTLAALKSQSSFLSSYGMTVSSNSTGSS